MIKKLTKEQEKLIPIIRDKWLKIVLSTERVDKKSAIKIMGDFYEKILNKKRVPVVVLDGIIDSWYAVLFYAHKHVMSQVYSQVRSQVYSQVMSQLYSQVRSQVYSQVRSQVYSQVRSQVYSQARSLVMSQVYSQVMSQLYSQVMSQVDSQVRSQVISHVRSHVRSQVMSQVDSHVRSHVDSQVDLQVDSHVRSHVSRHVMSHVDNFIYPYIDGHLSSSYFSYYDFMEKIGVKKYPKLFNLYKETSELGLVYPLDDICIVSDRPCKLFFKNGLLHKDGDSAIEYLDGLKMWFLNGVKVPQYLSETKAEEIDCKLILKEKNAEIRREFVRKVGVERLMLKLGAKLIDKQGEYELLNVNLGDEVYRPYLKMRNPSLGVWHVEGVHPDCKTVEQSLKWRNQTDVEPTVLT